MAKSEFVMLAHEYDSRKHGVAGWYLSEKLDGMRAVWDGGISRGKKASEIPWANTAKDSRYISPPIATGLWSRYGNVIHAPGWLLDQLPPYPLDGELWGGIGRWQETQSIVKKIYPDEASWRAVRYMIFDLPPAAMLFGDRVIDNTNFRKTMSGCYKWYILNGRSIRESFVEFEQAHKFLTKNLVVSSEVQLLDQTRLPFHTGTAIELVEKKLEEITDVGGEGLMLRRPASMWVPERTYNLLKVKKLHDAEATVIGYTWGKETDKGSKLLGKIGSIRCRMDSGGIFDLSGFTDAEREVVGSGDVLEEGTRMAGREMSAEYGSVLFPRGSRLTFRYRELSRDGIPKEARYLRRV